MADRQHGQATGHWPRAYLWAGAAGAALGAWWLVSSRRDWYADPILETDFDSFLVRQTGEKTGLDPKPKKKSQLRRGFHNVAASDRGKVSGPFDTFLKQGGEEEEQDEDDDPRNPLDFNSFLKTALPAAKGAPAARSSAPQATEPATTDEPAGPQPHQARILVLFGTEYGFSKEIAEKLCAKLREAGPYW